MEVFLIGTLIIVIITIVKSMKSDGDNENKELNNKEQETMENDNVKITEDGVQVKMGARDLLMWTLTKIGCQYTIDGDDIFFYYQGEHFYSDASNEYMCINIWDCWWLHCEMHDEERISRMKQAVNVANSRANIMTFYTTDEADSNLYVHCKKNILFIPQITNIEDYLRSMLREFFEVHRLVILEMERQ